jgi:hypothetical protein
MARESKLVLCDCGCGQKVYHNQLVEVTVETPVDETLRQAKTKTRFWVTRKCKEPYEEELALMRSLMMITVHYAPKPSTRWWLVNAWLNPFYPWPRLLRDWWRRIGGAVKIMRIQHAIYIRPFQLRYGPKEGFQRAHDRALQSAILCGCPRFMQGFLAKRYLVKAKNREKEANAARPPEPTVVEAEARA